MGFSAAWLDLREPADHSARDPELLRRAAKCAGARSTVLDLGSGTGSTARAFNGAGGQVTWRFLDADAGLLAVAGARHPGSEQVVHDLREIDTLPLGGVGLVTASALLDLMPEAWIASLAQRLAAVNVPFYAALNYNGQMSWEPPLAQDAAITAAFNQHQSRDKGLGLAAGPFAALVAERAFRQHGYHVLTANSPWSFGAERAELHGELLQGIADAANEMGAKEACSWCADRQSALSSAHVTIGHTDLLALPATYAP